MILKALPGIVSAFFLLAYSVAGLAADGGGENASNPLAKVKNTDLRWQYFDTGNGHINDVFVEGAFMANDNLKIKYELHYWETNVTGTSEQNLESTVLKAIYFPKEGQRGDRKYRLAIGLDWIVDHGDQAKGIGSGSDQLAPFVGIAIGYPSGLVLIPLVQHFTEYSGLEVNTTAFRLIAMKSLSEQTWFKLDAKLPIEWENNNAIPATAELQLGKHYSQKNSAYIDLLVGLGKDRPYDWGLGIGLRFKY